MTERERLSYEAIRRFTEQNGTPPRMDEYDRDRPLEALSSSSLRMKYGLWVNALRAVQEMGGIPAEIDLSVSLSHWRREFSLREIVRCSVELGLDGHGPTTRQWRTWRNELQTFGAGALTKQLDLRWEEVLEMVGLGKPKRKQHQRAKDRLERLDEIGERLDEIGEWADRERAAADEVERDWPLQMKFVREERREDRAGNVIVEEVYQLY